MSPIWDVAQINLSQHALSGYKEWNSKHGFYKTLLSYIMVAKCHKAGMDNPTTLLCTPALVQLIIEKNYNQQAWQKR